MTGILGSANLLNGPSQAIYVNNRSAAAVVNVNFCNRNPTSTARVRLAVSDTQTPGLTEWVEYDVELLPNTVLERTGIWVNSTQYVVARADVPNVSVMTWGVTKGSVVSVSSLTVPVAGTVTWSTGTSLLPAPSNVTYRADLRATDSNGGTVFYNLTSGSSLPRGLGLTSGGELQGIPLTAGSYTFTITASNGTNTANRTFSLVVNSFVPVVSGASITTVADGVTTVGFGSTGTFLAQQTGTIEILAWGGGGSGGRPGGWTFGAAGGAGGFASGTYRITEGETINIVAGGGGVVGNTTEARGGGGYMGGLDNSYGGNGGGFSGVLFDSVLTPLLIAGGGGGGGSSRAGTGNVGGAGGGTTGQDGVSAFDSKPLYRGRGGTQTAAGEDATSDAVQNPTRQGFLRGGMPRASSYGGAGGGGYWGGSGGGYSESNTMAGGGGGSGYVHPRLTNTTLTSGNLTTPGNNSSSLRTLLGYGAGDAGTVSNNGANGLVIIRYRTGT